MKLEIRDIWSPDLNPPSEGLPPDVRSFSIFVQALIGVPGERGGEVFSLMVTSPDQVAGDKLGFVYQTMVLDEFSWAEVRTNIERLFAKHGLAFTSWDGVFDALRPFLRADAHAAAD